MKKLLTIVILLAVGLPGGWFVLTKVLIDADKMALSMAEGLEKATGRKVEVDEGASVKLFPLPRVVYSNFRIHNLPTASSQYLLKSAELVMNVNLGSLLTFSAHPGEIELVQPNFELETLPSGERNWQFADSKNNAGAFQSYFKSLPIKITNGTVRYVNPASAFQTEMSGLNGTIGYQEGGKFFAYEGTFGSEKETASVLIRLQSVDLTQTQVDQTPLQLKLDYKGMHLLAQGMVENASREFNFVGDLEVRAANTWAVYAAISGKTGGQKEKLDFSPEFSLKGKLSFGAKGIRLEDASFEAVNDNEIPAIKGVLALGYVFGKTHQVNLIPTISTIDLDHLEQAYMKWFSDVEVEKTETDMVDNIYGQEDVLESQEGRVAPFLSQLNGALQMKVENAIYHGRSIRNLDVRGVIDKGELLIQQAQGVFPGNTKITAYGTTKRAEDGMWFEGKLDVQGESLENFMSAFAPKGIEIPPLDLGKFILRTNLSYNPKQFRLAETQAAVRNSRAAGAFIVHRGDRIKIETFLRMQGLDLDVLNEALTALMSDNAPDEVKAVENKDGSATLFNVQYDNARHDWLNALGADILADVVFDDFVLWERKGRTARFRLEMERGKANIKNLDAEYNGTTIKGDFGVQLDEKLNPYLSVSAAIGELDMVDLFPDIARSQNDEEWKTFLEEQLEFMPLQSYRGKFAMDFGKLRVKKFMFENLKTVISLEDSTATIDSFSSKLWDGQIDIAGKLQAGTIPAMGISISFASANLNRISQVTPLLKHAAGLMGIKAQITTSGVAFMNWLKNAQGNFAIAGQDISVQGFGLSTLARAVPLARSVQDLDDAKKQSLENGAFLFRQLEGQGSLRNAEINIPGITYKSEDAQGTIEGKVNLLEETVNLKTMIQLVSTFENGAAPEVNLFTNGPIDSLEKSLETQDLDAYVARKAAERTLKSVR